MPLDWIAEIWNWYAGLGPDMKFLFGLPFGVAAAGLAADAVRRRRGAG